MFTLIENKNGDFVLKYRKGGKVIYISAEKLDMGSWELKYNWEFNKNKVESLGYEYLIMKDLLKG